MATEAFGKQEADHAVPHEAQLYTTFLPESELLLFSPPLRSSPARRRSARTGAPQVLGGRLGIERFARGASRALRPARRSVDRPPSPKRPRSACIRWSSEAWEMPSGDRLHATHVQAAPLPRGVRAAGRPSRRPRPRLLLREHTGDTPARRRSTPLIGGLTNRSHASARTSPTRPGRARPGGLGDTRPPRRRYLQARHYLPRSSYVLSRLTSTHWPPTRGSKDSESTSADAPTPAHDITLQTSGSLAPPRPSRA